MRRRIKRIRTSEVIILIASIIVVNFIGVSYAYWTESSNINVNLSTSMGNIDPQFCSKYLLEPIKGNGELSVSFEDEYTMIIEGVVEPDYKAFLHYCVVNKGSIPAKYDNQKDNIKDGINVIINQESGILEPGENFYSETGNSKLDINALSKGNYRFDIMLPFKQWIKD